MPKGVRRTVYQSPHNPIGCGREMNNCLIFLVLLGAIGLLSYGLIVYYDELVALLGG